MEICSGKAKVADKYDGLDRSINVVANLVSSSSDHLDEYCEANLKQIAIHDKALFAAQAANRPDEALDLDVKLAFPEHAEHIQTQPAVDLDGHLHDGVEARLVRLTEGQVDEQLKAEFEPEGLRFATTPNRRLLDGSVHATKTSVLQVGTHISAREAKDGSNTRARDGRDLRCSMERFMLRKENKTRCQQKAFAPPPSFPPLQHTSYTSSPRNRAGLGRSERAG
ncbi:hypothetical protein BDK51DRAFT_37589 [Blyttiomyces helicus]|uniref:Uncharacterized protein n=1 Tax=Blyttiomyces helicus TaxID=388810 RepID=A0A4P9WJS9_9FUNG|nr:hypothetical protein BDK51DRAFT_37589 [Blyttiomyces helicus]|eukprot:RKO92223.1 hypothetical protein BDK51DRAFT_37589 [Blyttiomyces helicus]